MDNYIYRYDKYLKDYQRISCWVYLSKNKQIQVFQEQKENTEQIYIQFYNMNHYFWSLCQNTCIKVQQGFNEKDIVCVYNSKKLKQFFIKYMIKDWNISEELNRKNDGSLDEQSLKKVYGLHPRILKTILDQYIYRTGFTLQEEGRIQKQCYLLFNKGSSVSNPHWAIGLYCDLVAFWQKFGLNYYDVQNLPQDIFDGLRKVLNQDNKITSSKINSSNKSNINKNGSQNYKLGF